MAAVIRLRGLKNTADSGDIRFFFSGLKIPHGGVHIIGGEHEEAFIMFDNDEDGRRAMKRSGGHIKNQPVDLRLSSKSEMQCVLEASTKKVDRGQHTGGSRQHETKKTSPSSQTTPMGNLSHRHAKAGNRLIQDPNGEVNSKAESDGTPYVGLKGMPFPITEEAVCHLFQGLQVDRVILKQSNGKKKCTGFVKFRTREDARTALKRTNQYRISHHLGRYVKLFPLTETRWLAEETLLAGRIAVNGWIERNPKFRRGPSPAHPQGPSPAHPQRYIGHARSCSPVAHQDGRRSRSPLAYRSRSPSPSSQEFCVLLENLPYSAEKSDIKELFRPADLQDDQIFFLLDNEGKRTRSLFVLFRSRQDYDAAQTHHKQEFLNRCVYISSIAKKKMTSILEKVQRDHQEKVQRDRQERLPTSECTKEMMSSHPGTSECMVEELPESYSRSQERLPLSQSGQYNSEKVCIYVRNLPLDVRKVEIMDFFYGFGISEDSVILLNDNNGVGLGEALVIFQTEVQALTAQSLNGQRFLGSELLIRCLERSQMREFGVTDPAVKVQRPKEWNSERYSAKNSEASVHSRDMKNTDFKATCDNRIPLTDLQVHIPGSSSLESNSPYGPHDRGNGSIHDGVAPSALPSPNDRGSGNLHNRVTPSAQDYNPTLLKLVNLPFQITIDEIYDFCHGYRIVPGSVTLGHRWGRPDGTAQVVFESRQEALAAVDELSGRAIGKRKVGLVTCDNRIPLTDLQVHIPGSSSLDSNSPYGPHDRGNGSIHDGVAPSALPSPNDRGSGNLHNRVTPSAQNYNPVPTLLKLVNLPLQFTIDEIYDFCHGYRIVPGSVTLGHRWGDKPDGTAQVVFESRQEALAAIDELSGRAIGKRKVGLLFV